MVASVTIKGASPKNFNSLGKHPVLNGIRFDVIEKNVTRYSAQIKDKYDILLINKNAVNFRKLFPEYANYQQHLGLSTFSIDEKLKQYAIQRGVTVLQRSVDALAAQ